VTVGTAGSTLQAVAIEEDAWIAEIDTSDQSTSLAKKIEELRGKGPHLIVFVSVGAGKSSALAQVLRNWVAHGSQRGSLIDLLTPTFEVPRPEAVLQARRNSEARRLFLEEFGALTSGEVAELAGSRAANRSALANRWRKEGRILGVTLHDTVYYPGFQFDEHGRPLPLISEILWALDATDLSEWEVALWFTKRSGWLGDRRPVDLLLEDPDTVLEAARRERHDLVT
jgi:hypothetical protein